MTKNYIGSFTDDNRSHNQPLYRRNARGLPYTITNDRISSNANGQRHISRNNSHAFMLQSQDSRNGGQGAQPEKSRKRIPVACGRCRQRKIKCTGKESDEQPGCAACRLAGYDGCTFDRVNSRVVPYKDSVPPTAPQTYPYDTEVGRMYQARIINSTAQSAPATSTYSYTNNIPQGLYRNTYPYPEQYQRPEYYTSSCGTPAYNIDATSSFGFQQSCDGFSQDSLTIPYAYSQQPPQQFRQWTPSQTEKTDPVYFETTNNGLSGAFQLPLQYQQQTAMYPQRSSLSSELPPNFSFSNVTTSLPQPTSSIGNDRILPMPSMASLMPSTAQSSMHAVRHENPLMSLSRTAEMMSYNTVPTMVSSQTSQDTSQISSDCSPVHTQQQQPRSSRQQFHPQYQHLPALQTQLPTTTTLSTSSFNASEASHSPSSQASYSTAGPTPCDIFTPVSSSDWVSPSTIHHSRTSISDSFSSRQSIDGSRSFEQEDTQQQQQQQHSVPSQTLQHHSSQHSLHMAEQGEMHYYSSSNTHHANNDNNTSHTAHLNATDPFSLNKSDTYLPTQPQQTLQMHRPYILPYNAQEGEELERRGSTFLALNERRGSCFNTELAENEAEQEMGLSRRDSRVSQGSLRE